MIEVDLASYNDASKALVASTLEAERRLRLGVGPGLMEPDSVQAAAVHNNVGCVALRKGSIRGSLSHFYSSLEALQNARERGRGSHIHGKRR